MSHIEYQPDIFVYTDDTTGQNDDALNPVKPLKGIVIRCTNGDFLMVLDNTYLVLATYKHESPNDFDRANPPLDETQSPWVLIEQ
jgi:hypothetical protein